MSVARKKSVPAVAKGTWRFRQLINAGFAPATATAFAQSGADLHRLFELLDRGCPPHLAARIMAPLDMELPDG